VLRRARRRVEAAARCRRPGRRCVRYVRLGSFRKRAHPGLNRVRVPGRLRGSRLRPGGYQVKLAARDAAGNRARLGTLGFRILPPRHPDGRHRRHR
jgi:hypothetical protein